MFYYKQVIVLLTMQLTNKFRKRQFKLYHTTAKATIVHYDDIFTVLCAKSRLTQNQILMFDKQHHQK